MDQRASAHPKAAISADGSGSGAVSVARRHLFRTIALGRCGFRNRMRTSLLASLRVYLTVFVVLIGLSCFASAATDNFRIVQRVIPPGFEAEASFLELLKSPDSTLRVFRAENAPHWDISAVK